MTAKPPPTATTMVHPEDGGGVLDDRVPGGGTVPRDEEEEDGLSGVGGTNASTDTMATIGSDLLARALSYARGGLSLLPCSASDKRPMATLLPRDGAGKPVWTPYQSTPAGEATVREWFEGGCQSVAAVCGVASGGLLVLDFDEPRFYDAWLEAVGDLADGLPRQRTGGGGLHVWLRCPEPGGNQKLAWMPDEGEETGRRIAIETRGEGGCAILPGSLHPSGKRYEIVSGDFTTIPTIPQAHADALLAAARKLDEAPLTRQQVEAKAKTSSRHRATTDGQASIIDAYNSAVGIEQALESCGYTRRGQRYARPGGVHPNVTVKDGRSFHWGTNDPLCDGYWHRPFDVFCHHDHGGDCKAAVRAAALKLGVSCEDAGPRAGQAGAGATPGCLGQLVSCVRNAFRKIEFACCGPV